MLRELILWLMLSATAYRLTRLVVKDTFPPVLWVRDRLAGGWRPLTDKEWDAAKVRGGGGLKQFAPTQDIEGQGHSRYIYRKSWSPHWLAELITCPWCASAYVSGAVTLVADLTIRVQWPFLTGFAVWAVAAPLAARDWP